MASAERRAEAKQEHMHLPWLRWHDSEPIAHTFRYGAESLGVPVEDNRSSKKATTTSVSSFAAMDVLLEALCDRTNYPSLELVVVAGHSAGGQFVHRYGISSGTPCLDYRDDNNDDNPPRVRLVAANPRSFAYLDGRRYLPRKDGAGSSEAAPDVRGGEETETLTPFGELELRVPDADELDDCAGYNRYEWGLESNPDVPAPYVSSNLDGFDGDEDEAFCRYALRDVVYLSGERDVGRLGDQICDEDGYQGPSRRERSERFFAGLQAGGTEAEDRTSAWVGGGGTAGGWRRGRQRRSRTAAGQGPCTGGLL